MRVLLLDDVQNWNIVTFLIARSKSSQMSGGIKSSRSERPKAVRTADLQTASMSAGESPASRSAIRSTLKSNVTCCKYLRKRRSRFAGPGGPISTFSDSPPLAKWPGRSDPDGWSSQPGRRYARKQPADFGTALLDQLRVMCTQHAVVPGQKPVDLIEKKDGRAVFTRPRKYFRQLLD